MSGAAGYFSQTYAEARKGFLGACDKAGAEVSSRECPAKGPEGEALFTDVAWIGPKDARAVLVTFSATHGVEGFCGSGVQIGWLETGLYKEMPADTALLQVHAINPHGFAWLRRVTEDNVDLNRNFVDHDAPYPANDAYDDLRDAICPDTWDDATIASTQATLDAYADANGPRALQAAISGGQYSHAEGIFFGGHRPTWSRKIMMEVFATELSKAKDIAVVDYHTGLGPRGYGERICIHQPESENLARVKDWYSDDFTSPYLGTSSSVELNGFNVMGMEATIQGDRRLTAIALEYGTLPSKEVKQALRADNWLHIHGDPKSEKGRGIKAQIREAFYQDQDDWKDMIWERGVETQRLALKGLAGS